MNAWERLLTRVDDKPFTGDRKKRVSIQPQREREKSAARQDVDSVGPLLTRTASIVVKDGEL